MPEPINTDPLVVKAKQYLERLAKVALALSQQLDRRPGDVEVEVFSGDKLLPGLVDVLIGLQVRLRDQEGREYVGEALEALLNVYDEQLDVRRRGVHWKQAHYQLLIVQAVLGALTPEQALATQAPMPPEVAAMTRSEVLARLAEARTRLRKLVAEKPRPPERDNKYGKTLRVIAIPARIVSATNEI